MHIHPSGGRLWCQEQDRTKQNKRTGRQSAAQPHILPEALAGLTLHLPGSSHKHVALTDSVFRNRLGNVPERQVTATSTNQLPCPALHTSNKMCVSASRDTWGHRAASRPGPLLPAGGLSLQGSTGPRGARGRPALTATGRDGTPLQVTQQAAGRACHLRSPTHCAKGPRSPVRQRETPCPRTGKWSHLDNGVLLRFPL